MMYQSYPGIVSQMESKPKNCPRCKNKHYGRTPTCADCNKAATARAKFVANLLNDEFTQVTTKLDSDSVHEIIGQLVGHLSTELDNSSRVAIIYAAPTNDPRNYTCVKAWPVAMHVKTNKSTNKSIFVAVDMPDCFHTGTYKNVWLLKMDYRRSTIDESINCPEISRVLASLQ
jgi:chemotaxis protein CheY-P-specific phosphatase CheC